MFDLPHLASGKEDRAVPFSEHPEHLGRVHFRDVFEEGCRRIPKDFSPAVEGAIRDVGTDFASLDGNRPLQALTL